MGEGGGCIEDVSLAKACEVGEADESRELRPDFRIGGGSDRKPWTSEGEAAWPEGEGERREGSGEGEGECVGVEWLLSSGTPTTAI